MTLRWNSRIRLDGSRSFPLSRSTDDGSSVAVHEGDGGPTGRQIPKALFVHALVGCLLLTLALPAAAGRNHWTSHGPQGGGILALLVKGGLIYAVSSAGTLYQSSTHGESLWGAVDGSFTFALDTPASAQPLRSVILARNANDLYAAVSLSVGPARLYRSTDSGLTWVEMDQPLPGTPEPPRHLVFDGQQGGYLSTNSRLFVTADGGRSWRPASLDGTVHDAVVGPGGTVYVASSAGVYVSTNRGRTWERHRTLVAISIAQSETLTFALSSERTVVYSADGFRTWNQLPTLPAAARQLIVSDKGRVYVNTAVEGVYVFDSTAQQWLPVGNPGQQFIRNLAFAPGSPGQLFAGTAGGVFVIESGLESSGWRPAGPPFGLAETRSIAMATNGDIYAATARGVSVSVNGGQSWREVEGLNEAAWVTSGGDAIYVADKSGIHRTLDDGETWTTVSSSRAHWLGMASTSATTLYKWFDDSLSRSRDGGVTWTGITPPYLWYSYLSVAAVEPADAELVYAGYAGGVARSQQGGGAWSSVFGDLAKYNEYSALAVRGSFLQAAVICSDDPYSYSKTYGCGIASSVDGGASWSALDLSEEYVSSIVIDPVRPWRSYAGTASGRVYRNDDFPNVWIPFGERLPRVRHLAISDDGDRIYAATDAGVYVYEIASADSSFEPLPNDPARLPRLIDQLLATQGASAASGAGLLIPAVGNLRGSGGLTFHTDVTLANGRPTEQEVFLAWLPQGNSAGANVSTFRLTLPAAGGDGDGVLMLNDLAESLDLNGLGALLVFAVQGSGNVDTEAEIDGFARIRSPAEGGGWVSQSLAAVPADAFMTASRSRVIGLRHEWSYRTNVGIVNLGSSSRTFTVLAEGEEAREQFTISVPPFAPVMTAVPNRNYGGVSLTVIGDGSSTPFVSFGSSVDNTSGDAWAVLARPLRTP